MKKLFSKKGSGSFSTKPVGLCWVFCRGFARCNSGDICRLSIQASSVDFAVFHASLALAVLAANKEPSINITFQNPLANEFLQIHHDFFKCEAFQIENSKRIAYGIAPPILERVNQLLYSNNGTIQAIGSFFLLQEVLARKAMRQFDVFTDTNNIAALKKCAASTLSGYARELASNCLRIMEIPIPVKAGLQM